MNEFNLNFYKGKKVLVTGHTGFKGTWLCRILQELGAEVNVQNANGDLEQQKKQINYFIDKGMDVIVVICIDSKGLTEEVQRAKDAGIKIIAYDRLLQNTDIDLY